LVAKLTPTLPASRVGVGGQSLYTRCLLLECTEVFGAFRRNVFSLPMTEVPFTAFNPTCWCLLRLVRLPPPEPYSFRCYHHVVKLSRTCLVHPRRFVSVGSFGPRRWSQLVLPAGIFSFPKPGSPVYSTRVVNRPAPVSFHEYVALFTPSAPHFLSFHNR